jgi:poly(A)-specific ribonuclease
LLTAEVFVKLSSQLACENKNISENPINKTTMRAERLALLEGTSKMQNSGEDRSAVITEISKPKRKLDTPSRSRFAHRTRFDVLTEQFSSVEIQDTNSEPLASSDEELELIPGPQSSFWNIYSNKLRVFGTEERIFVLGNKQSLGTVMATSE